MAWLGMRVVACGCLLALTGRAAVGDGAPAPPPSALEASRAVIRAVRAGDLESWRSLALGSAPDPWLVADLLAIAGETQAVQVYVAAAEGRPDTERLAAYVAGRRGSPADSEVHRTVDRGYDATKAGDRTWLQEFLDRPAPPATTVSGVRWLALRGDALLALGRAEEGEGELLRAADAARDLGWLLWDAYATHRVTASAFSRDDHARARAAALRELEVATKRRSAIDHAAALANLGLACGAQGDRLAARDAFARAVAEHESLGAAAAALRSRLLWGRALNDLGDPAAGPVFQQALDEARAASDPEAIGDALSGLGTFHMQRGQAAQATEAYEEGIRIRRAAGRVLEAALLQAALAKILVGLGEGERAVALVREAASVVEAKGTANQQCDALEALAFVLGGVGEHEQAAAARERALGIARQAGSTDAVGAMLLNLAVRDYKQGRMEDALRRVDEALTMLPPSVDPRGRVHALTLRGDVLVHEDRLEEAVRAYRKARIPAEEFVYHDALERIASGLARAHLFAGDLALALDEARRAMDAVDRMIVGLSDEETWQEAAKAGFARTVAAEAAFRLGRPEEFFGVLERGRATLLLASIGSRRALAALDAPKDLVEEEQSAERAEAQAAERLRAARREGERGGIRVAQSVYESAVEARRLAVRNLERYGQRTRDLAGLAPPQPTDLRGLLAPDEAWLEYGIGVTSWAVVLGPDGALEMARLGGKATRETLGSLRPGSPGTEFTEALAAVRAAVVAPLRIPATASSLLVSPDGPLGYLPPALLFDRPVAFLPSAATFVLLRAGASERGEGILAVGDPETEAAADAGTLRSPGMPGRLSRLPGAVQEAREIGSPALIGREATEAALWKALSARPRWRAVHFACHGLVHPERPMLSALALTPGAGGDGFLTAHEIARSRIPADLVVLSACETGTGRIVSGVGIASLARSFMLAGAPRVIVSLWKVDDEATRALMTRFYERWKAGTPTRLALHEAQAFVRSHERWSHPAYWAGWALWGLPE